MIHFIPEWIELVSLAFMIGALSGRIWIFPSSSGSLLAHENSVDRVWRLFGACIASIVVTNAIGLFLRASEMSGKLFSEIWGILPTVIIRTHFGRVWLIRTIALIALAVAFKAGARIRARRGYLFLLLVFPIVISMTESASGHASDAGDFSLTEFGDWLHLISASLWGGGLFVLPLSVLPALDKGGWNTGKTRVTADIACRFSRMAGLAIALIAVTALYNSILYVGGFAALATTPYGRTALMKLLLFLAVLGFGAFNRYESVPLLRYKAGLMPRGRGISRFVLNRFGAGLALKKDEDIARHFSRRVKIEAALILAILLGAALLRSEIPPHHLARLEHHPAGAMDPEGMDHSP